MNENLSSFLRQHDSQYFHPDILRDYTPVACLADGERAQTYLASHNHTDDTFVIKVYNKQVYQSQEGAILQGLRHSAIPPVTVQVETPSHHYVVRPYVQGKTLQELCCKKPLPEEEAIGLMLSLCDVVAYLHGQIPPVIHRDIKPSNVVVDKEGQLWLIDFEISRQYDPADDTDTLMALTRAYAAPEQFGYAQTDQRSDIYSMGVLLLFALTQSTNVRSAASLVHNQALVKILQKCTEFSPSARYQQVGRLRSALLRARESSKRRRRLWMTVMLVFTIGAFAGFWAGHQYAASRPAGLAMWEPAPLTFAEPQMENAIRLQLGKEDGSPLYPADMDAVTELYIFGNRTAKTTDEYWRMWEYEETYEIQPGTIATLQDAAQLKNLRKLYVTRQPFGDLSPLRGLGKLQELDLRNNESIMDVSPLQGKPITMLWINSSQVGDLSPLQGMPLASLSIGDIPAHDLSPLAGNSHLREMDISYMAVDSLAPLLTLPALATVTAYGWPRAPFEALGALHFTVALDANIYPSLPTSTE